MKICFFVSDFTKIGGIERVTSTLVTQLNKREDCDIDIVSMFKGKSDANYELPKNINTVYLLNRPHGVKPHSIKRIIALFSNVKSVRRYFKNNEYDLIVGQSFPMSLILYMSGLQTKLIAVEHVYSGYYNKAVQSLRNYVYSQIRQVVVLTNADKRFFSNRIRKQSIEVIPNPVRKVSGNKAELHNKKIITVGRLEYQKGYDNLMSIFRAIHEKHPDWTMDIYGEGSLRETIQRQIDGLELSGAVNLCGVTKDIDSKLRESSIFVMSSRFEGFGMVLVEALSIGVPCVSYDCPNGPGDIIKTGVNGILVKNQNKTELHQALEKLIEDTALRKELGSNGPDSVQCFSENVIADKWYRLFLKLKNNHGKI